MLDLKAFSSYPLIALLLGVSLASLFGAGNSLALLFLLLAIVSAFCAAFYGRTLFFYVALLVLALALGMLRYLDWKDTPRSTEVEQRVEEVVEIVGVVRDEPDVREGNTHLTVLVQSVDGVSVGSSTQARVLVFAPRYPEYQYGDVISVKGKLVRPKKFAEDDGRVFDYPRYLASKGIHYQIFFPQIALRGGGEGNSVVRVLFEIKHAFQLRLSGLFPEPHNALLGGLLLGGKQSLGEEWQETFRTAGVIHIVVLSGYNMTIVSEWLVTLFRFLGFYGSLTMGGVGIFLFALMAGAGATVVRAGVMAGIALLARATGRTYTMGRALLVAGVLMVLHNPSILMDDPSFQLSFLASLGLIFVSPVIERRTNLFARSKILREVFISTLATQAMVLPLLLYQTGLFSLVSLPANMAILPIIPLTMFSGFLVGLLSFVFPLLAPLAALVPYAFLSWVLSVAELLSRIPYASVAFSIGATPLFLLYAALTLFLWREHKIIARSLSARVPHSPHENKGGDKKEKAR